MPTCVKFAVVVLAVLLTGPLFAADPEPAPPRRLAPEHSLRLYELRKIQAAPGKLDALHARLRDHQIPLLEQHGIWTQAVFVPVGENPSRRVYLLTAAEGLGPMVEGWADLRDDPKWREVVVESDKDGKVVAQQDYQRLITTHWSPAFMPEKSPQARIFELRTYHCPDPNKHAALLRRFHDHTMKLFEKHGMHNLVYWVPDERPESQQRLVYLLAHKSQDAAKESFASFRSDPEWLKAKQESEERAGGSLTNLEGGVVSEFLVPAEYSPLK
jgi:hypothetical protein